NVAELIFKTVPAGADAGHDGFERRDSLRNIFEVLLRNARLVYGSSVIVEHFDSARADQYQRSPPRRDRPNHRAQERQPSTAETLHNLAQLFVDVDRF